MSTRRNRTELWTAWPELITDDLLRVLLGGVGGPFAEYSVVEGGAGSDERDEVRLLAAANGPGRFRAGR